jgi:ABC-type nitrate/sulfonate/bicarbonate transport system ATPase subunit
MDEPFSALDEPTRYEMQDLIVGLWSEIDSTIILISHSVAEAVYLGDRLWVMSPSPGTIVAEYAHIPSPDPTVPAMVAQSDHGFAAIVAQVSREFLQVLETPRDELRPVHADGNGARLSQ